MGCRLREESVIRRLVEDELYLLGFLSGTKTEPGLVNKSWPVILSPDPHPQFQKQLNLEHLVIRGQGGPDFCHTREPGQHCF